MTTIITITSTHWGNRSVISVMVFQFRLHSWFFSYSFIYSYFLSFS